MAPSLTARASPLPFPRLSCAKNHRLLSVRCRSGSSGSDGDDKGTPPVIRAAVSAITELLRALSPVGKPTQAAEALDTELELPRSVDDVVAVLEADYGRAYFLTGNFTLGIYAEDCLFEDPTIKFRGTQQVTLEYYVGTYFYCISSMKPCQATSNRRTLMCQEQNSMMLIPPLYSLGRSRYSQNLDLLVPFFDSPSLKLEDIEKGLRADTKFVIATWTLRTYLRLPWRPLIAIRGNTTYDLDEEYKVVRHAERWDVSALEAIGQLFVSAPK